MAASELALVFPGQGSQSVGMGRDLFEGSPAARAVFEKAQAALDFPLLRLCFEGPEEELRDTACAQPAIVAMSIATLAAAEERLAARGTRLEPAFVAGHSVGQYAALVAAGALDFAATIRLVGERGRLMKAAGERHPGGMAAVLGLDEATVEEICREARAVGIVCAANYNMPGQTVISGDAAGLNEATRLALARGARKVTPLAVSVANHSPLMAVAAEQFGRLVEVLPLRDARVPLIANSSARALVGAEEIRQELRQHMTGPVRWTQAVQLMATQVTTFWELGPGQVLTGLIKRSAKEVAAVPIGSLASIVAHLE